MNHYLNRLNRRLIAAIKGPTVTFPFDKLEERWLNGSYSKAKQYILGSRYIVDTTWIKGTYNPGANGHYSTRKYQREP